MTKIADIHAGGDLTFICDFSPPRGAALDNLDVAQSLAANCLSIPYNPGKSVYAHSAFAAHFLRGWTGKDVLFTVATRDMNVLAIQSLIVGASLLGLENVLVVRGDDFTPTELHHTMSVGDRTTTALIRSITAMNSGLDFRGRRFNPPTDMCIGATIDTNRTLESEVALTRRKIDSGAHFFVTQPGFTPDAPLRFLREYERALGGGPSVPIFFGIHMAAHGSRSFSPVPQFVIDDLARGSAPADIASRAIDRFIAAGITEFYLMPPVLPGGARDYESARQVLDRYMPSP